MNDTNGKEIKSGDKIQFTNISGMTSVEVIEENNILGFHEISYDKFYPLERLFEIKNNCKDKRIEIIN